MKTALKIFGGLFAILILIAAVAPFFIDVNKYRPEIEKAANERINGKFSLGELKISFWGRVHISAAELKLQDTQGKDVVSVQDVAFDIPFLSVLSGSPSIRLILTKPKIFVVRATNGKINLMDFVKTSDSAADTNVDAAGASAPSAAPSSSQPSEAKLPPLVFNSRLTFILDHAKVNFDDRKEKAKYDIDDVSLTIKDVSPSGPMPFDLVAMLGLQMATGTKIHGAFRLNGSLQAKGPASDPFQRINGQLAVSLTDADITVPGTMSKQKGVPLQFTTSLELSPDKVSAKNIELQLADVQLKGTGSSTLVGQASQDATGSIIDFNIQSNKIELAKLGQLFPAVAENQLNGTISMEAKASGPASGLNYEAKLNLAEMTVKPQSLTEALSLKGSVHVVTDQIKQLTFDISSKNLNGKLTGSLRGFSAPRFDMDFSAGDIDLDQLIVTAAAPASASTGGVDSTVDKGGHSDSSAVATAADLNQSFAPLRNNPMAAKASGIIGFQIKSLTSKKVKLDQLKGKFALSQLVMKFEDLSFKVFGGSVKSTMSIDAKPAKPAVAMNTDINGIKTEVMAESQLPMAKNSVSGAFSGKLNIGGSGLNQSDINKNWKGSGQFQISDAKFATLEIGKQIKQGLIDKLPEPLKSRVQVSDRLVDWKGEYKLITVKYVLDSGTLNLPEVTGTAAEGKGLDLKGAGKMSIVNYNLDFAADFIDRQGMLGSGFPKDRRYGVAAISAKLGGTLLTPQFDWGHTISALAKNAVQDTVKSKAADVVSKQAEKIKAPEAVKGFLKKLF
jgi:uncharacterized protein involved in outer membrane biogenesis